MMYDEVVRDFASRTRANLRAIEKLKSAGNEVFEATQLINSTLGLLVFPQQEYVDAIPEIPLEELKRLGWPIPKCRSGAEQVQNLNQLIRYLRNAVAHFNLKFIGDAQDQIHILHVWNQNRAGVTTWEAELSVSDLRGIAERFIDLLLSGNQPASRTSPGRLTGANNR